MNDHTMGFLDPDLDGCTFAYILTELVDCDSGTCSDVGAPGKGY
jgi:hypothetical protein